jgi:hypothetical protein
VFAFNALSNPDQCSSGSNPANRGSRPYYPQDTGEEFNLLHTILYYLYTGHIIFCSNSETTLSPELPKPCAIEDIYMAADRMLLGELKEKALGFLKLSCTPENIGPRVLSKFSELHENVASIYADYFRRNWDRIKGTKEFNKVFTDMNGDLNEVLRINNKFRELMKDAVFLSRNEDIGVGVL